MAVTHPNPVTVDNAYNANWTTARPYVEDDVQALAANQNALNDASQEVDARVTALTTTVGEINTQPVGIRRGLRLIQSTTSPQTDFRVVMDRFTIGDGTTVLEDVDVLIDIGDSGANGLDTGSITPSSFYYVHICYDSTKVLSPDTVGVVSLSSTPTLPTGYDKSGLVDNVPFILVDSDGELVAFSHIPGCDTIMYYAKETDGYTANVTLTTGSGGDGWHAEDVSSIVPAGVSGAWLRFRYDGTGAAGDYPVYIRPNWGTLGDGGPSQRLLFYGHNANDHYGPFWVPLDEDGIFQCRPTDDGSNPPTFEATMVGLQLGSL